MRKSKAINLVIIFYDTYFYQVYSELFADFYGFMSNPLKVKECNALHTILVKTKLVSGQILFRALSRLLCPQCTSPISIKSYLSFKMLLRKAFTG